MRFPDRRKIPQCTRYKYLGGYETSGWRGRHDETLATVKRKCCQMIRLIGRVPILGPEQIRRAVELAVSGICGFYGRSTPIPWATCKEIEAVRAEVLQRRGISPSSPRLPIFAPCEAGGLGHTHTYQIAASAFVDQVDRMLSSGAGAPARGPCDGTRAHAAWDYSESRVTTHGARGGNGWPKASAKRVQRVSGRARDARPEQGP
jgi:hypothetical protein